MVHFFFSGHPHLEARHIDRFGDLPDAKLVGRYSTPLLLRLWSLWIKQNMKTTKAEIKVLQPISFAVDELNRGNRTPTTGFHVNGTLTENLENTVTGLSAMVPKEWTFSYFARQVKRNKINCDEIELFKKHMESATNFVDDCMEETEDGKPSSATPGSKKPRSTPSKIKPFATSVTKTFVFEKKHNENITELDKLETSHVVLGKVLERYIQAGVIKRVQFDVDKLVKFHEEENNAPKDCGKAILTLWKSFEKRVEDRKEAVAIAKKSQTSAKITGKRKIEESSDSLRSSPRNKGKKSKSPEYITYHVHVSLTSHID